MKTYHSEPPCRLETLHALASNMAHEARRLRDDMQAVIERAERHKQQCAALRNELEKLLVNTTSPNDHER